MKAIRLLVLCAGVILVLSSLSFLFAQTYQGRILGTVTDSSGAVVGGAQVTITNTATGISRKISTTTAGELSCAQPGTRSVYRDGAGLGL